MNTSPASSANPRCWAYPGTFDPITRGHEHVIHRLLPLCDELVLVVAPNRRKRDTWLTLDERIESLHLAFDHIPKIRVDSCAILIGDWAHQNAIGCLIRGIRDGRDYEDELAWFEGTRWINPEVEVVWIPSRDPHCSSHMVREVIAFRGYGWEELVPAKVEGYLNKHTHRLVERT